MRYQNGFIGIITLLLAALTMVGSMYTEDFSQASHAESIGFDALAHDLFNGVLGDDAPAEDGAK